MGPRRLSTIDPTQGGVAAMAKSNSSAKIKRKGRKTASELCRTHPGVFERHRALVLALCESGVYFNERNPNPRGYAAFIVEVASAIVEATEQ